MVKDELHGKQTFPDEFALTISHLRDSLGVSNWPDFKNKMFDLCGVEIKVGSWQHLAPKYKRQHPPNGEILWILESCKLFRFLNGEPVTAGKLLGIYFGAYDYKGNPTAPNGAGSKTGIR